MSQLNDSIGLINNKIFQVLKVENLIFQKLMNTPWSTNNNVRSALSYDT